MCILTDPTVQSQMLLCQAVPLRIHDILAWIRIRIRVSMPLTIGSGCGSGSFYFHQWPSRCQQNTNLKRKIFCIFLFEGTFTSFFKGKKLKRSHKTVEIKVSYYFCWMFEGSRSGAGAASGSTPLTNGSGSGSRRPKHTWIRIRIRNTGVKCYISSKQQPLNGWKASKNRFFPFMVE